MAAALMRKARRSVFIVSPPNSGPARMLRPAARGTSPVRRAHARIRRRVMRKEAVSPLTPHGEHQPNWASMCLMGQFDAHRSRWSPAPLLLVAVFLLVLGFGIGSGAFDTPPALPALLRPMPFVAGCAFGFFLVGGIFTPKPLLKTSAPPPAISSAKEGLGGYTPRSYADLKDRSLVLAAGIEKFAAKLPPLSEYAIARPPTVKWIFLPNRHGGLNDDDNVEACYFKLKDCLEEVISGLGFSSMGEDYGAAFWVWEDIRPTVKWVHERLPQIYLLAHACDCNLEGWTFEDDWAWEFGLSDAIREAGFNPTY